MDVLAAGCGWLGTAAAEALAARGDRVTAVVRTPARAARLAARGIPCLARDLAAPGGTAGLPRRVDGILATQAAVGGGVAAYRRAYVAATRALLDYAHESGATRFVAVGSTGVFGQSDGGTVDEATPPAPSDPTAEVLVEAERRVLAAASPALAACVVRASGLYGPGRTGIIERVRTGALALGPGDDTWMNFCHRDDAVAILLAALDLGAGGAVYHASDGAPARRREVVAWIARRLGVSPARRDPGGAGPGRRGANRRVSSEWTRDTLGVGLAFPDFRTGLAPWIRASAAGG